MDGAVDFHVKNTFIEVDDTDPDSVFGRTESESPTLRSQTDPTGRNVTGGMPMRPIKIASPSFVSAQPGETGLDPLTSGFDLNGVVEEEYDDDSDDEPLAKTERYVGIGTPARPDSEPATVALLSALAPSSSTGDAALMASAQANSVAAAKPVGSPSTLRDLGVGATYSSADSSGLRVKNTFIDIGDRTDSLGRTQSNETDPLARTQSDPTGQNLSLPNRPKRPPGEAIQEAPAGAEVDEDENEENEDAESDDDGLCRTNTYDASATSSTALAAPAYPTFIPGMGQFGGYAMQQPWGVMPFMAYDPAWMQPEGKDSQTEQGMCYPLGEGPPLGMLHNFHKESHGFGTLSSDLRQFTKGQDYEGRLSVVSESQVHRDGIQRYMVQFTAGQLSKADGIGFVFASRLPCAKNIQKIVSIFANQRGQICMRVFGDIVRASAHVRPFKIGDWIEMAVDLENFVAYFNIWPSNPMGWPMPGRPESHAEFHYGKKLTKASQQAPKPVKPNVGHFACVIQNVGVTVAWGS